MKRNNRGKGGRGEDTRGRFDKRSFNFSRLDSHRGESHEGWNGGRVKGVLYQSYSAGGPPSAW